MLQGADNEGRAVEDRPWNAPGRKADSGRGNR